MESLNSFISSDSESSILNY